MDQEQSWITIRNVGEDDNTASTVYEYFMSKEPREELGPIRLIDDEFLGRTKVRDVRIGMTRNAKEENKKEVIAYLQPYPHTRIDTAKPLQGWYKSLHEPKGVRPRPCLLSGSLVDTPSGSKRIEDIQIGNEVWGFDIENKTIKTAVVQGISSSEKKDWVVLELESGKILRLTPEHLVYTTNRGWVVAGELTMEDNLCEL